jgi:hypothetical protein
VSDYGLNDRTFGVRSPAGVKDFSSILCVQTGSEANPASCTMDTGGPSLMMEAVRTSETSVDNYFTRHYIPEDNSEQVISCLLNISFVEKALRHVCPLSNIICSGMSPYTALRYHTHTSFGPHPASSSNSAEGSCSRKTAAVYKLNGYPYCRDRTLCLTSNFTP